MARGFVTGMVWGVAAAAAGLALLSQVSPLPDRKLVDPTVPEPAVISPATPPGEPVLPDQIASHAAAEKAKTEKVAAEKAASEKMAADKAAADKAAAEKMAADKAAADKVTAEKMAAEKAAADKVTANAISASPPAADTQAPPLVVAAQSQPAPSFPAGSAAVPSLTGLDQALTMPEPEPVPAVPDPSPARPEGPKDALLVPGQPQGQPEPARLPQIAPVADPDVAATAPEALDVPKEDAVPVPSPAATLKDDQPTLPPAKPLEDKLPTTVLDKTVPGVRTDQLPQIGAKAVSKDAPPAPALPIQQFARAFENPAAKPLFVILLHDVGAAGMRREDLAKLPFPVSFVVDPLATDASEASRAYRAAGQEVLTLANGIPKGATAEDLETTFQTLSGILPQSVAVLDQDTGGFQDQRPLATLVVPVIQGEGRGLVTYDRGLNAADQIARRNGLPAAMIYRRLDAEGESKSTIRRYLDRAAFKAAQDGLVVVIGDTRADTVAAILEWTVEGKSGTVALAPVTAVLGR